MAKAAPQITVEIARILAAAGVIESDLDNIRSVTIRLHASEAPVIEIERFIHYPEQAEGLKASVRTIVDYYDITKRSEVGESDDRS